MASALGIGYVLAAPKSLDLAAHLLRAHLFSVEGFGLWNNWWYGGHDVVGYSVLFPPLGAALSPQAVAAAASALTALLFAQMVCPRFGGAGRVAAVWFAAATATNLFTGRLTFAFGLLPAMAMVLALDRKRPRLAAALAVVTALASPVAALFAAVAGLAWGWGRARPQARDDRAPASRAPGHASSGATSPQGTGALAAGGALAAAALLPVLALAVVFPEGGTEPFAFSALWPILLIAGVLLAALPTRLVALRAGVLLYVAGCIAAFAISSPVGGNAARLGPLMAGPLAALVLWKDHRRWLLLVAPVLLYIQWQAPVRDLVVTDDARAATPAYYQPLLGFLQRQGGPAFRVEIPFTRTHWESYVVAPVIPLARGWERQLDRRYNGLFYGGTLTSSAYHAWLKQLAVRFVALPDAPLDTSGIQEAKLIRHGAPYLQLVFSSRHWRIYAVRDATPIAQGAAVLDRMGPNWLLFRATRPGRVLVRVHYSPYWALPPGAGCVRPAGQFTELLVRRAGPVRLGIDFAPGRIGARSARCS